MFDHTTLAIIAATFLLAGTVKGIVGLGLPTIALGVLTVVLDLPTAMALLLVPSLLTNIWQAAAGGHGGVLMRRLWPFFGFAVATVWIGAMALSRWDLNMLSGLLGGLIVLYAVLNIAGVHLTLSRQREKAVGVVFGAVNGVLTGMTGSFLVPGVLYLQAVGLTRDQLVQAMGILFLASTLALGGALQTERLLSLELGLMSSAGIVPAFLGMAIGQRIRQRLSEGHFRRFFFIAILVLGGTIIAAAVRGG